MQAIPTARYIRLQFLLRHFPAFLVNPGRLLIKYDAINKERAMRTLFLATVAGLAFGAFAPAAFAHSHGGVSWSVNVGIPGPVIYGPPAVYQPAPVYVAPRPVYVEPRPVYVAPAPVYFYGTPAYPYRGHWHHHHHYRY
jgi:hypothetical protein